MPTKKLEFTFLLIILVAVVFLANNYYKNYTFKHNELPLEYQQKIKAKEQEVLKNMQKNYGFVFKVPIVVTDKFKDKLYGLTSYKNGQITIYLNKKVMQESMQYMLDSVIPHEYAHALLFKEGYSSSVNGGHTKIWKKTCIKLGGKDCRRYVDQHEIIMSKLPFSNFTNKENIQDIK